MTNHGQQGIAALAIVALAAAWLLWRAFRGRGSGSCGNGECHAVSPEVKKLKAKLKR
jgi:hypothetical protein